MKRIFLFAVLLLLPILVFTPHVFAQNFAPIVASQVEDASQALLQNGQVCFQPVGANSQPTSFTAGGGGTVYNVPVCRNVVNGVLQGSLSLATSDHTSPVGINYQVSVIDNVAGTTDIIGNAYICLTSGVTGCQSGTWSLDAYAFSGVTTMGSPGFSFISGSLTATGAITAPNFHGLADAAVTAQKWASLPIQCPSGFSSSHFDISGNALDCNANSFQASGSTTGTIVQAPAGSEMITLISGSGFNVGSAASHLTVDVNGNTTAPNFTGAFNGVATGNPALAPSGNQAVVQPANTYLSINQLAEPTRTVSFGAGAPCFNWGDSITVGDWASPVTLGYAYDLDAYMGWTCTNMGVSGSQLMDSSQTDAMMNTAIQPNTISTILTGANDMHTLFCSGCVTGMDALAPQQQYMDTLRSTMAWLALPTTAKATAQTCTSGAATPSCVFTGTWATSLAVGAKTTIVPGSSVTVFLQGTAVYIASMQQLSNSSTYTVTVDGVAAPTQTDGVFSTAGYISKTFNDASRNFSQKLIRIAGLPETQHTVVFTCTAADASDPCYFVWAGSNGSSTTSTTAGPSQKTGPYVFMGNTLHVTPTGYATFNGSDAIVATFDAMVKEVANELASDGLQVQLVDAASAMDTHNAALYFTDGFHPSTLGHAAIAQQFESAITASLLPSDRGMAQIMSSINACTLFGSFAVGGCPVGVNRGDLGAAESTTEGFLYLGLDGGGIVRGGHVWTFNGTPSATSTQLQFGGVAATNPGLNMTNGTVPIINFVAADAATPEAIVVGGSNGTPISRITIYSFSATPASVSAFNCAATNVTVSGILPSDNLTSATPPSFIGGLSLNAYANAGGGSILTLVWCNVTAAAIVPPSGTYRVLAMH